MLLIHLPSVLEREQPGLAGSQIDKIDYDKAKEFPARFIVVYKLTNQNAVHTFSYHRYGNLKSLNFKLAMPTFISCTPEQINIVGNT